MSAEPKPTSPSTAAAHPHPCSAIVLKAQSNPAELAPVRRQVESFCASCGLEEMAAAEVGLCVNEAMANVIRHAYHNEPDQPIELTMTLANGELCVSVRDWGSGSAPSRLPTEKSDPFEPGGLGLICLGRLMDRVSFTPQRPTGMLLEMFRRLDSAAASPHTDAKVQS